MRVKKILIVFFLSLIIGAQAQDNDVYAFEVSKENPYGKYNPKAPKQLLDYEKLMGSCKCKSESRKKDGTWNKPVNMVWKWKYIMNGTAVQDETLKEDGSYTGSIRQYDIDSLQWNVHYYTSKRTASKLPVWNGNKTKDGKIILYRKQKAPNGTDGFYRLTFYNISEKGYNWIGEWVDIPEKIVYPTWKIACLRPKL